MTGSKVQIFLDSKVARRTNIKGIRLGVSTWWQSRTPPLTQTNQEFYETIIKGFFNKFRYILADLYIYRTLKKKGVIVILGTSLRRRSSINTKLYKNRLTVYLIHYLQNIMETYLNQKNEITYRQQKNLTQNSSTILAYVVNNKNLPLIKSLNKINRWVRPRPRDRV